MAEKIEKRNFKPEDLLQEEADFLKPEIAQLKKEESPKRKSALARKMTIVALTSLLALGIAKEAIAGGQIKFKEAETTETIKIDTEKYRELYKLNFEKFSNLVEDEKTFEKLTFLKEKFGGILYDFLSIHRIEQDLNFLQKLETSKENEDAFINPKSPLTMTLGSIVSNAYENRWLDKESQPGPISVEGTEAIPDLSNEQLKEIVYSKYPKKYLENSISSISYDPEIKLKEKFIIMGRAESFGIARLLKQDIRASIEIYNLPEGMTKEKFIEILEHEIHHPNSWEGSQTLSSAKRINMFYEVSERAEAENRFHSEYVEGLKEEDLAVYYTKENLPQDTSLKQVLSYIRTNEYWPEIAKAYFDNPEELRKENPEDYELVKKWINRQSE